jgi:ABC-type transporter Mla maintaining outer membrane lipid asymmetry ATPase subunit MlaF
MPRPTTRISTTTTLPEAAERAPDEGREGSVVVSGKRRIALAQHIAVGPHHLLADEPVPVGDDTGPTPYDLLLARSARVRR